MLSYLENYGKPAMPAMRTMSAHEARLYRRMWMGFASFYCIAYAVRIHNWWHADTSWRAAHPLFTFTSIQLVIIALNIWLMTLNLRKAERLESDGDVAA